MYHPKGKLESARIPNLEINNKDNGNIDWRDIVQDSSDYKINCKTLH